MARAYLSLEEQASKSFHELLHMHNKVYNETKGLIGPDFVNKVTPYINRFQRKYAEIKDRLNNQDKGLIQISIKYWKGLAKYHSLLH